MTGILVKLKKLLNSIDDFELTDMDLWIDNSEQVDIIALDDDAIVLITDKRKLKIDDKEW